MNKEINLIKKTHLYKEIIQDVFTNVKDRDLFDKFKIKDFSWKFSKFINKLAGKTFGYQILKSKFISTISSQRYNLIFEEWKRKKAIDFLDIIINQPYLLNKVKSVLSNDDSKKILDWIIKYRIAYAIRGHIADFLYPLPKIDNINSNKLTKDNIKRRGKYFKVKKYYIDSVWCEMHNSWLIETYYHNRICKPCKEDIVISAGGLYGETAIWFADKVGPNGKVFSFEPLKKNIKIFKDNIIKNNLTDIITIVDKGLWDKNETINFNLYDPDDPFNSNGEKIQGVTLDHFVEKNKIDKIDFIKMDIEGAELTALKGAEVTIKKFKPILAICVYHLPSDIIEIPLYIKMLVPEYKIYLSHKLQDWVETVLFAVI